MKYGNRSIWRNIVSSPITLFLFIFLFIFMVRVVWNMNEKLSMSKTKLDTATAELVKLEKHKNDLANKIKYLSTDEGIEAELRTKYRALREGESVAVIIDNEQVPNISQSSTTPSVDVVEKDKSWLKKFFGL